MHLRPGRIATLLAVTSLTACAELPESPELADDPVETTAAASTPQFEPPLPVPHVHIINVDANGEFDRPEVHIASGDRVEWRFANPADGSNAIVPVVLGFAPTDCPPIIGYDPANPNDVTGPWPQAAPGIFALSQDNTGFVSKSVLQSCAPGVELLRVGFAHLCSGGGYQQTMATTWADPNIDGVFIRLRWSDVNTAEGVYDFTILDREVDQAVRNGKLYSLGIKAGGPSFDLERSGTPDWIFSTNADGTARPGGGGGVTRLHFFDRAGSAESDGRNHHMDLGAPTEARYWALYRQTLKAVADHLKERADRYRALAYIKPSGANLFTHENRLPDHCDGTANCSRATWSAAGYTPTGLRTFFDNQRNRMLENFPNKTLSYALIHAGFPIVADDGSYADDAGVLHDPTPPVAVALPSPTDQTSDILVDGRAAGLRWAVQHNGLGPLRTPNDDPNFLVVREGDLGQPTGFQTNNEHNVANPVDLDGTLLNLEANSDGIFLEIYEDRLWEATRTNGGVLDPAGSNRTLRQWSDLLYARQRALFPTLPDPRPSSWSRTLTRTTPFNGQRLYYRHPSKCGNGFSRYGTIVID